MTSDYELISFCPRGEDNDSIIAHLILDAHVGNVSGLIFESL